MLRPGRAVTGLRPSLSTSLWRQNSQGSGGVGSGEMEEAEGALGSGSSLSEVWSGGGIPFAKPHWPACVRF